MKHQAFLFSLLVGCGGRVEAAVDERTTVDERPGDARPSSSASEVLRSEQPLCAFGAGAGHLVWIDAASHHVRVARAVVGGAARDVGIAASTCALSVRGTRFCFADSSGSLSCMNVDGSGYETHGDRLATDPVRTVDLGRDLGLIFARRRTVYGRLYEPSFSVRTMPSEIIGAAGDFDPSPDDGVEWAVLTRTALQRMGYGETSPVSVAAPIAMRALQYSRYLVLSEDRLLRSVNAGDGATATLDLGGAIDRFTTRDRWEGESLIVARDGDIVAVDAQLYFEPRINKLRVVARAEGEVVAIAVDEEDILWGTTTGEIRRGR